MVRRRRTDIGSVEELVERCDVPVGQVDDVYVIPDLQHQSIDQKEIDTARYERIVDVSEYLWRFCRQIKQSEGAAHAPRCRPGWGNRGRRR